MRTDESAGSVRQPVTGRRLVHDLARLGVQRDQTLLVHASVRSIGLLENRATILVSALRKAVAPVGNVVALTATEENSLTSRAHQARTATMTADEIEALRQGMPAFDRRRTPSTTGALSEALRTSAGAVRSDHPQSSFAAIGPRAGYLMAGHRLNCHLGEDSPLAKLYQMGAQVLLLGVGYDRCTAFHLAEYRYTPHPPRRMYSCAVKQGGRREWREYEDVVLDDKDFEEIGKELNDEPYVKEGYVGNAMSHLMPLVQSVDHAVNWMATHRALPRTITGYGPSKG